MAEHADDCQCPECCPQTDDDLPLHEYEPDHHISCIHATIHEEDNAAEAIAPGVDGKTNVPYYWMYHMGRRKLEKVPRHQVDAHENS